MACGSCDHARVAIQVTAILAVAIILASIITNSASLTERKEIIKECNERIARCNEQLGRCSACLYEPVNVSEVLNAQDG